jgi:hypothetical protein
MFLSSSHARREDIVEWLDRLMRVYDVLRPLCDAYTIDYHVDDHWRTRVRPCVREHFERVIDAGAPALTAHLSHLIDPNVCASGSVVRMPPPLLLLALRACVRVYSVSARAHRRDIIADADTIHLAHTRNVKLKKRHELVRVHAAVRYVLRATTQVRCARSCAYTLQTRRPHTIIDVGGGIGHLARQLAADIDTLGVRRVLVVDAVVSQWAAAHLSCVCTGHTHSTRRTLEHGNRSA